MARILIVDDEPVIVKVLSQRLVAEGYDTVPLQDSSIAVKLLETEDFDLLVSDIRMSPVDGMELLRLAHSKNPAMPVIMMTGYATANTAAEALKLNVFDYLSKPFKVEDFIITVKRALEFRASLVADFVDKQADRGEDRDGHLVAVNPVMKKVYDMIQSMAVTDAPVLIIGEFGTGKETVARKLHDMSPRKANAFVVIPCAEFPEPILEEEMFGGESLFVSGTTRKKGLIETASGGTIYLKDIDALPLGIQQRLLDVLRSRRDARAKNQGHEFDVRVLGGTTSEIKAIVEAGDFSRELFALLGTVSIEIKPLRERKDDIMPLAFFILRKGKRSGDTVPKFAPEVQKMFLEYPWPGNVGELEHAIECAVATMKDDIIRKENVPSYITESPEAAAGAGQALSPYQGIALKAFLRQKLGHKA